MAPDRDKTTNDRGFCGLTVVFCGLTVFFVV